MHNRKKKVFTEAELEHLHLKTEGYNRLASAISEMKKAQKIESATLDLIDKMIVMNPDFYSLWNFRREIINKVYESFDDNLTERELNISSDAIKKNPKSYCAWHHRLWVWSKVECDVSKELSLCDKLLAADQRNFHCWNYRRSIVRLCKVEPEHEISFSMKKIEENFSNYSAFHHRSVYIKDKVCDLKEGLDLELGLVHNAIFTEPDDQSAWWYYQFLIDWAKGTVSLNSELSRLFKTMLEREIETIRNLLELESKSKWAMVTLAFLLQHLARVTEVEYVEDLTLERRSLLRTLCDLDIIHRRRYLSLLMT